MIYFARIHIMNFETGLVTKPRSIPVEFIKIGFSVNPESRVTLLSREYNRPVELLATVPGDIGMEAEIHDRFNHIRLKSTSVHQPEWFYPVPELLEFINSIRENSRLPIMSSLVSLPEKDPLILRPSFFERLREYFREDNFDDDLTLT